MSTKLITFDSDGESPLPDDATVLERTIVDDIVAALVEIPFEVAVQEVTANNKTRFIEDEPTVHLLTADAYTSERSDQFATIQDVRRVHNVADDDLSGAATTAAVMDSGIADEHPDFKGHDVTHVDCTDQSQSSASDEVGHGTASSGQVARLADDAALVNLRVFGDQGTTGIRPILRAYQWLYDHADEIDVVNCSWGANTQSDTLDNLHNKLVEKGIRDVTSAGNSGTTAGSPATAKQAFTVGACTEHKTVAPFSSYNPGTNPDVTAVGVDCRLARAPGTSMGVPLSDIRTKASGTSFSAPEVTGLTLRYIEANSDATPAEMKAAFVDNAEPIPNTPREGAGLVDYGASVDIDPNPLVPYIPAPQEHESERAFEDHVEEQLVSHFSREQVHRQHRFPSGRIADFLVQTSYGMLTWELENDSGSLVEGAGQALFYREAAEEEFPDNGSAIPVLCFPQNHIDEDERPILKDMGVVLREVEFSGNTEGV